jgi:hypothetical protein
MFTLGARTVPVLLGVIIALLAAVFVLSLRASAASVQSPTFTKSASVTGASFAIPKGSDATWTLRLWSHGQLIGSEQGTAGTLSVALPAAQSCTLQADVRTTRPKGAFRFYSGLRTHSVCCPPLPTGGGSGLTTSVSTS